VVALARRARISPHRVLAGPAVHARCFVLGIAHARRGQLGQHRIDGGARFRVEQAIDAAHPVSVLLVDGQVAAPCSLGLIGWLAVLVEQQCQPIGGRPPLRRSQTLGDPGKVCLGLVTGLTVDAAGRSWKNFSMTHTCSRPIWPRACAAAVFASLGANGSPVIARRGPSSSACLIRRHPSTLEIPSFAARTSASEVPRSA